MSDVLPDPTWLRVEDVGDSQGLWLPFRLTEGRERDIVIAGVMSQFEKVETVLGAHAMPGSPVTPPMIPAA